MVDFLKGNYKLPGNHGIRTTTPKQGKGLTEQMEEMASATLGGSMCFVMKGTTFLWAGDETEDDAGKENGRASA